MNSYAAALVLRNGIYNQILALLPKWAGGMPSWARVFITARPEEDIETALKVLDPRSLVLKFINTLKYMCLRMFCF